MFFCFVSFSFEPLHYLQECTTELTEHGRHSMRNNQLPTRSHVELEDNVTAFCASIWLISVCTHIYTLGELMNLSKAEGLCKKGAVLADSPSAVAQRSDIVFTIVGWASYISKISMCFGKLVTDLTCVFRFAVNTWRWQVSSGCAWSDFGRDRNLERPPVRRSCKSKFW